MKRSANARSRHGPWKRAGTAVRRPEAPGERSGAVFHVAGVIVHAVPSELEGIARRIAAIAGAHVHASSAAGKLVVTLEGAATDAIVSGLERIRRLPGVVAAALVYQHGEDECDALLPSQGGSG